jgi:acyl-CoA thioesterase II
MELSTQLKKILKLHQVEFIEAGIYRCDSLDFGLGHVFGGQVMGQALASAQQQVPEHRILHSLHAYFLRSGDESLPIVYRVENMRDGRTYSARRVEAIQKGQPIFYMTCSFKEPEKGLEHQIAMPEVSQPEALESQAVLMQPYLDQLPKHAHAFFEADAAFEMRPVEPLNLISDGQRSSRQHVWLRANGTLPTTQRRVHQYLLAYISDFNFLLAATRVHGISLVSGKVRMATIDHAMWFHQLIDLNEWILYEVEHSFSGGGRAFVSGRMFTQQGTLVAQMTQEGMLRLKSSAVTN